MPDSARTQSQKVAISSLVNLGSGAYIVTLPGIGHFEPGQWVGLALQPDHAPRLYSIASVPNDVVPDDGQSTAGQPEGQTHGQADGKIEVLFTEVDDGLLTPRLARMSAGDTLLISGPGGSFRDAEPGRPVWWIANGTGIAPFISMLRARRAKALTKMASAPDRPAGNQAGAATRAAVLVHGARTCEGLYYADEIRAGLDADTAVRYVPCLTRDSIPGCYAGRLTSYLSECELDPDARYLLCGSAEMINDVRDLLISRGIPFEAISSEVYF